MDTGMAVAGPIFVVLAIILISMCMWAFYIAVFGAVPVQPTVAITACHSCCSRDYTALAEVNSIPTSSHFLLVYVGVLGSLLEPG